MAGIAPQFLASIRRSCFEQAFALSRGITSFYFRAASVGDVSKDQYDSDNPGISAPDRRSAVVDRAFGTIGGDEEGMVRARRPPLRQGLG